MGRRLQNIIFRLFLTSIQYMSVPALSHLRVSRGSMPVSVTTPQGLLSLEVQKLPVTVWWRGGAIITYLLASALPAFIYLFIYLFSI
jgi:hypothetical protein